MKARFWASDWFAGLVITLLVLASTNSDTLQGLERSAYDWGVRSTERFPSEKIAIIAIDDESIANIGRWPWSRDVHAALIDKLNQSGAKVIGHTAFFLEPQTDPGIAYIKKLVDFYSAASFNEIPSEIDTLATLLEQQKNLKNKKHSVASIRNFYLESYLSTRLTQDMQILRSRLFEAEKSLDTDTLLANSLSQAGNVILAMPFILGEPRGNPDEALPKFVLNNAISKIHDRVSAQQQGLFPLKSVAAIPPIKQLGQQATSIGHLNVLPDVDGAIRSEPLVLQYYDRFFPSISLQLVAKSLNLSSKDIKVNLAEGIEIGGLKIKTDSQLLMNTFYYADFEGFSAFPVDSFYDVVQGKIPAEKYKNKIVLIGATATGIGNAQVTPINPAMSPVLSLAHSVSSILNEDFFISPDWGIWVRILAIVLIAAYLMFAMPRLKAGVAAAATMALFLALLTTHYVLMTSSTIWIQLMLPATLLILGHLLITTKRFLMTERGKLKSDEESSESNRMLGIAYQSQGQLDMAFEKFRKCPLDEQVMEALYNLALDMERKRQFNKAGNIYDYMMKHDANFHDIETRKKRAKAMEDTVMMGGSGHAGGTLMLEDGAIEKPMLGRYEVEKELGKGAMGVVYLGKDPKISRVVAIKTMALSQEFEGDELEEVKERFFREAETAGRLSHPNIVTIFDAGEEHDLAYIAMEFLKGADLAPFTKPNNLLEIKRVVSIVIRSAEALDFAHKQNVVHRDIKPANLMYEPESDTLKITDFGIARITDSSKTKTGMVLGTPSYMSPEQLAGKKVDGRSDLFSLGVMCYQLLTGTLPFTGDSMASLMFKITNENAPDILSLRADIPTCLVEIINKTLIKNPDERYQTGMEIATELKSCLDTIR